MKYKSVIVLVLFLLNINVCLSHPKDIIVIDNPEIPISDKEAILILPGFNSKKHGVKDIRDFFAHKGYDVFIPHYLGRDSLQQCVNSVNDFMNTHHLNEYKKLHVFSYIAGTWVLNLWIQQHPNNNIASIVYDRSPMQERIPLALSTDNPFLFKLLLGNILKEFAHTPYPFIENDDKRLGFIIENKPTKLFLKHKKTALKSGVISFKLDSLKQSCDDYFYDCINHDEMYYRFNVIGPEILYFFKNGFFTKEARKEYYDYNLFNKEIDDCGMPTAHF